ncbi:MAG TPA: Hsp20 family protein [Alphaproteobacteria bacterium]
MRTFDLTPLFRTTVGFDRLNRMLEEASQAFDGGTGYPPYNIEKLDEDTYRITMAVAGFGEDELDVTVTDEMLVVSGRIAGEDAGHTFLHRGIATRAFERRFQLADHIKVSGAKLENGLLHVELSREIPVEKRPRKIAIGAEAGTHKVIEGGKAA